MLTTVNSGEQWRAVVGYEDSYEVSDLGRVRRNGKILKDRQSSRGYRAVSLYKNCESRNWYVHRLVLFAFRGAPRAGQQARHFPDGDPANNRLDNLLWGTSLENHVDQRIHGTVLTGEKNPHAKLDDFDARCILRLRQLGMPCQVIGNFFAISTAQVSRIGRGQHWPHLSAGGARTACNA